MKPTRMLWMVALALLAGAVPAWAQTYDAALNKAGDELAAAMARQGLGAETSVGIAGMIGDAGVACEPLSSILTGTLRRALIQRAERIALRVKIVEEVDPKVVRAVVSGRWYRDAGGAVRLILKLGDVTSMKFNDIAMDEVKFDTASLPPEARRCVLELEPIEREVKADRPLIARAAPSSVAGVVARIETGDSVWLSARVLSEGAEDWFVVRLPDDEAMPVGMRERRAFVYGVTLPKDVTDRFKVTEMDVSLAIRQSAKIRAEPSVKAKELGLLEVGAVVDATGKVVDRDWYRIAWRGEDAYIYAPLTGKVDAAEAKAWKTVKEAKDRKPLETFLADWPKGAFAAQAREKLAALGPPPLDVQVWTERKTYRKGETIKVFLKGNKDFFARVVYRDAKGNLVQLLPNAYRKSNQFAGGRTYAVPDDSDRFDLEVGAPFGEESIVVFASTTPVGDIAGQDIGSGLTLLRGSLDDIRARTRGVAVTGRPPGDAREEFSEASARLTTGP